MQAMDFENSVHTTLLFVHLDPSSSLILGSAYVAVSGDIHAS